MSQRITSAMLQPFYDEDDVRRLCGLAVFVQADAMERAGHVQSVERTSDALSGDVLGVWRRIDRVTIQTRGNRLQPDCARHGAAFCQHAGALLLHWLRSPGDVDIFDPGADIRYRLATEFAGIGIGDLDDLWDSEPEGLAEAELFNDEPEEEIAGLLEGVTIAGIREIARRRGVRVSGSRKADVVRDASVGLADPANIDAALAGLSPSALLLLDAVQLSSASGATSDTRAFEVYRMLGGQGEPPLEGLLNLGLVFSPEATPYWGRAVGIPLAVVAQLPPREGLATPLRGRKAPAEPDRQTGSALVPLLMVVAQDAQSGGSAPRDNVFSPYFGYIPEGFVVHPSDAERMTELMKTYTPDERVRLVATPAMPAADIARLALQSGQPTEVVAFAARLMISLGIATPDPRLTIEPGALRRMLELDAFNQLALLTNGWLAMAGWAEASLIFGDDGPIRFAWNPRHAAPHMTSAIAEGIGLAVRLVGRMPAGDWYDAASFVETVERLVKAAAPSLATFRQSSQLLDFTWHGQPRSGQRLALRSPEGWLLFLRAIVDAVLAGPMTWLGLVEVQQDAGRVAAFLVHPTAAILSGKQVDSEGVAAPGTMSVSDDLMIVVPAGSPSIAVLAPILQACQLTRAAADGLHYQLSPYGLQALFESGLDANGIARLLEEQTGGSIPPTARATLDRWWASYGQIRLYDELTLIEVGDDLLLRELQAATSLESVMLYQFTPRVIAVDDAAVDQLVAELATRGYTPRIVAGD